MDDSYLKPCRYCGQLIRMSKVPNGTWQPFDVRGEGRHECSTDSGDESDQGTGKSWALSQLGHRLTCRIDCWWCSREVFFHTNGNGGCVLFDSLGWPWPVHSCWAERDDERGEAVQQMEEVLQSSGYRGQGELINIRPSQVPDSIPSKGRTNPPELRIKLEAYDQQLVDKSTGRIVEFIEERHHRSPMALPLPATGKENPKGGDQVMHHRAVDIWEVNRTLIGQLSQLGLPEGVDISILQAGSHS